MLTGVVVESYLFLCVYIHMYMYMACFSFCMGKAYAMHCNMHCNKRRKMANQLTQWLPTDLEVRKLPFES